MPLRGPRRSSTPLNEDLDDSQLLASEEVPAVGDETAWVFGVGSCAVSPPRRGKPGLVETSTYLAPGEPQVSA